MPIKAYRTKRSWKSYGRKARAQQIMVRIPRPPSFGYRASRYITGIHRFRRATDQQVSISGAGGLSSLGFDLSMSFSLAQTNLFVAASLLAAPAIPNAAEFVNLFDQYRIKRVKVEFFFSQNQSNVLTAPIPCLHICNDYNSGSTSFSKSDIMQHPDMKTIQLKEGYPIVHYVYPHVRQDVLTTSGITSTSAANYLAPWIDTTSNNVEHLGVRVYVDNLGRTSGGDIGTLYMKFSYDMDMKNVK